MSLQYNVPNPLIIPNSTINQKVDNIEPMNYKTLNDAGIPKPFNGDEDIPEFQMNDKYNHRSQASGEL